MAQETIQNRSARRSPIEMIVDRIWRFFCSVRAAIYEIVFLSVLVLLGTLRGSDAPRWLANAIPFTQPAVDWLYGWDVFHSLPFMLILALLCVAIIVCTINRVPGIWKTIANPVVRTTRSFLDSSELSASYTMPSPSDDAVQRLGSTMGKHRYRVLHEPQGTDVHVYADKNRLAKLGTFPFHLALILILIGGIVGARYGFRENSFVVPEGSIREVGHNTGLSIELVQFSDSWREDGIPVEYRSDLVLYKNGEVVDEDSITVNNPMTHGSVTIYQASYGQAASLLITDDKDRVLFDDSIPLGLYTSSVNPDAPAGVQMLPQVNAQVNVIAPDNDKPNAPGLDTLNLRGGQMFIQVRDTTDPSSEPVSAVVDQGDTVAIGGLNVQFLREGRFTLLQVASNPGMPIFLAAAFLLVGGLAITFYFPHRRIRGIISRDGDDSQTRVTLAPLARWDWSGQRDFHRIITQLETDLGVKAAVVERPKYSGQPLAETATTSA
ncbi:cytochrome c biogenesis protein ResB [soil metagenome]